MSFAINHIDRKLIKSFWIFALVEDTKEVTFSYDCITSIEKERNIVFFNKLFKPKLNQLIINH